MNPKRQKHLSKFLSLVLRHRPESIGIDLDAQGWTPIEALIAKAHRQGTEISESELRQVVAESDKQRFAVSEDGMRIRANQGHSVPVDLALNLQTPPAVLYHGTVARFLESIRRQGLIQGQRHHVHLSPDRDTAVKVGSRRGKAVVLEIDSQQMHKGGSVFYLSQNGVWLTDCVPAGYITFPE